MDSVLEVASLNPASKILRVSILVSVDSVLEVPKLHFPLKVPSRFNPSFCGFGIGGYGVLKMLYFDFCFNPSFCGFGIGGTKSMLAPGKELPFQS